MPDLKKQLEDKFGHRLRIRVNGILVQDQKILMIKHKMGEGRVFWNVPGGGMKYGQSSAENLEREFLEETGLQIKIDNYLFVHEFLEPPLHAIELFFEVSSHGGHLAKGIDPELSADHQLIEDIRFMGINEIKEIDNSSKHIIFRGINSLKDVRNWKGYFNFENKCIK